MSKAQVTAHLRRLSPAQRKILVDLCVHVASKLPSAEQVGIWITYDTKRNVYKKTIMKAG
jgi:hypothetical protein